MTELRCCSQTETEKTVTETTHTTGPPGKAQAPPQVQISLPTQGARPTRGGHTPSSDYTELAQRIRIEGLMRRRYGYYWTKLILTPLVLAIGVLAFIWIGDTWWQMFTAAAFAVIFTQIAFLGHDAAHRQIFKSGRWNEWISLIVGNLFVGMSYGWWQNKHTRHHSNPNKVAADPDIAPGVIAFTPDDAEARRTTRGAWAIGKQGWLVIPLLFLQGVALHGSSIGRVFSRRPVARRWAEILFLTVRLVAFTTLVFLVLSPGIAVTFLAVQLGVFGFYLGGSFAPNHKGMPIVPKSMRLDFLRRQVLVSRNIRGSRVVDTLMGGLNYQAEHHLFPSMPRPHLRRAATIVREYCATKNVHYTETGLFQSYAIIIRYLNQVGLRGETDLFDCPLIQQRRSI